MGLPLISPVGLSRANQLLQEEEKEETEVAARVIREGFTEERAYAGP